MSDRLKSLPKIELHLHLEGAAPPDFIRAKAKAKNVDIGRIFDAQGNYAYHDFPDFLRVYEAACLPLTSAADFHDLTLAVLEQSAAQGVIHTEAFLSPDFCGGGDLAAWRDHLAAIQEAASAAEARFGISLRGVITCIRHFGPGQARRIARCAQETAGDFITGFGIAGDENAGDLADFAYCFDAAREAGLGLTAHAGEWSGPNSVRAALKELRVTRIGHGVRAIDDPALVAELAARGITLEVCPGSNIALGLYPDMSQHPVARLHDAGVRITISTDDPPFFHTDMTREYARLARQFDWDIARLELLNQNALEAAFIDEATRKTLRDRLRNPQEANK